MKEDLKKFARANGERARVKAARVAVMLKLYQRDPERNHYLRQEAEQLARKVVYHMRQAVIVGSLIERIEGKPRQAISHDKKVKKFPPRA
jgi:hypothetical protein